METLDFEIVKTEDGREQKWNGPYGPIIDDTDELSVKDIEQQDFVDNTIYNFLLQLTGQNLPWDIEVIQEVFDNVRNILWEKYKIRIPYAEMIVE